MQMSQTTQKPLQHLLISTGLARHLHGMKKMFLHLVSFLPLYCPRALLEMSAEFNPEARR